MRRKSFQQRVKDTLIADGWQIKYTDISYIDFLSVRRGTKIRKAYRAKAHGHLTQKEQKALYGYGKRTGIHVIYTHETAGHELEFIRLYPQNLKTAAI